MNPLNYRVILVNVPKILTGNYLDWKLFSTFFFKHWSLQIEKVIKRQIGDYNWRNRIHFNFFVVGVAMITLRGMCKYHLILKIKRRGLGRKILFTIFHQTSSITSLQRNNWLIYSPVHYGPSLEINSTATSRSSREQCKASQHSPRWIKRRL